jgi:hypothetical protein
VNTASWFRQQFPNVLENIDIPFGISLARNLYVAVQSAVADASWPTSKMDFRSNEAGRIVPEASAAFEAALVSRRSLHFR